MPVRELLFATAKVLELAIWALYGLIIARAIVSWLPLSLRNRLVQALYLLTEPFLLPLRRLVYRLFPPTGLDFSPMIAILLLYLIQRFLIGWLYGLAWRF
ncbi:MAG: YggT family protein [Candidatus Bipolaricaulia bacterium]